MNEQVREYKLISKTEGNTESEIDWKSERKEEMKNENDNIRNE